MNNKAIVFITGSRADFGKLYPLIDALKKVNNYYIKILVTGLHLYQNFGYTAKYIINKYPSEMIDYIRYDFSDSMSNNIGNIISGLTQYIENNRVDMIIVHGDRIEALAGAIVGSLNNIKVAHIEGGELSGTIDDSLRHAITKLSHFHFVCNTDAERRLLQLGENSHYIYNIGSPDIDIMLNASIDNICEIKKKFNIPFEKYSIFLYHPVITELGCLRKNINEVISALKKSKKKYIVIYPNNDTGYEIILDEYNNKLEGENFLMFPSFPFESFLSLLYHSDFIIGNSSAGIRESGVYGIPAIDIGTRQYRRVKSPPNIQRVNEVSDDICKAIDNVDNYRIRSFEFGDGHSGELFLKALDQDFIWKSDIQKIFIDRMTNDDRY